MGFYGNRYNINIDTLKLNGYVAKNEDDSCVQSTDTINSAFQKVDSRIDILLTKIKELEKRIEKLEK